MNPFDPNFKSDLFTPTKRERGRKSMARKMAAKRMPCTIIAPPACVSTLSPEEKREARLRVERIEKGTL